MQSFYWLFSTYFFSIFYKDTIFSSKEQKKLLFSYFISHRTSLFLFFAKILFFFQKTKISFYFFFSLNLTFLVIAKILFLLQKNKKNAYFFLLSYD